MLQKATFSQKHAVQCEGEKTNKSLCAVASPSSSPDIPPGLCLAGYGNGISMCRILMSGLRNQMYYLCVYVTFIYPSRECLEARNVPAALCLALKI